MYVLYGIYSTIRNDIDERAMMESSEILAEMAVCAREFKENRCERDSRVPAMETVCNNWEKCMQRDPLKVGRSRLSAGMFAEIFNSFIEPISMKAMVRLTNKPPSPTFFPKKFTNKTPITDRQHRSNSRLLRSQQSNLRPLARQNPPPLRPSSSFT